MASSKADFTFKMVAICSAPRQVKLHPVKSTDFMQAEFFTV